MEKAPEASQNERKFRSFVDRDINLRDPFYWATIPFALAEAVGRELMDAMGIGREYTETHSITKLPLHIPSEPVPARNDSVE